MRNAAFDLPSPDRTALFLDVDGTMIDFAVTPSEVVVPDRLVDDIATIERALGGALAVVSGRTTLDIDHLFQPLRLRSSGVHGAEIRYDPLMAVTTAPTAHLLPTRLWQGLEDILSAFPGAAAENKRFSFAVNYRAAPGLGPRLLDALQEFAAAEPAFQLNVIEANLAFDIKGGCFNKGAAIDDFLTRSPFAGRAPIFICDDWTDESGFAAVERAGGVAYSVGTERPNVSGVFPNPAMVREWLGRAAAEMALS